MSALIIRVLLRVYIRPLIVGNSHMWRWASKFGGMSRTSGTFKVDEGHDRPPLCSCASEVSSVSSKDLHLSGHFGGILSSNQELPFQMP